MSSSKEVALVQMKQDGDLATAFTFITHNNACKKLTKSKLDSCDDGLEDDGGDSPLIVDVEETVAMEYST